jgi:hypothetical protein
LQGHRRLPNVRSNLYYYYDARLPAPSIWGSGPFPSGRSSPRGTFMLGE